MKYDLGEALHDPALLAFIRDPDMSEKHKESCRAELCIRKLAELALIDWNAVPARQDPEQV